MSVVNSKNWISQPDFSAMSCLKYVSNLHTSLMIIINFYFKKENLFKNLLRT